MIAQYRVSSRPTDEPPSGFVVSSLVIVVYVIVMPFLAGLPRGALTPVLRPSEVLQLTLTGVGIAMAGLALSNGRRWQLQIRPVEWWLLAATVAASVTPLLWLAARSQPVGSDQLLAAFPFVKYASLYVLVRACVRSEASVLVISRALVGSAAVISVIAIMQALGVGPVIDVLGQYFVSSVDDVVDGGRGTTTIGSSIATGAYLAISAGVAFSYGLGVAGNSRHRWLALAAFCSVGGLASGQVGTVFALGIIGLVVAYRYQRLAQLLIWVVPASALGLIGLWPIVSARLADLDQGSGLPSSWVIRWNNLTELYLPSLFDRGWLLGVNPDAVVAPPDVWRESVYLESGYLWLLWVGGLPLLIAVVGFLITAWRAIGTDALDAQLRMANREAGMGPSPISSIRIAAQAAVAMVMVLSLIDPHLTLRAGADLLYILIALGFATSPLAIAMVTPPYRWRQLLAIDADDSVFASARLQLAEADLPESNLPFNGKPEMVLALTVRYEGTDIASARLGLFRDKAGLRGVVVGGISTGPVDNLAHTATALAWRAIALSARSLRLAELWYTEPDRPGDWIRVDRTELKPAGRLAEKLELARVDDCGYARDDALGPNQVNKANQVNKINKVNKAGDTDQPRAIRFHLGLRQPRWKRLADLVLGLLAIIVTAPLSVISALLVARSSPDPVLYRQVRIGEGGLPFQILKFRTMYVGNDDSAHRIQNALELRGEAEASKDEDDPRITPIGRRLRRLSLDELPQLINVMRSEMSLVGPRPSLVWESELFQPSTRRRLTTKPGLTGLWQVNGRAEVSMAEMLELDLDYVDRMGPMVDLRCLAKTASSVVGGKGAR